MTTAQKLAELGVPTELAKFLGKMLDDLQARVEELEGE